MRKLLITDFIKSKLIQLFLLLTLAIEFFNSKTVSTSLLIFCIPYCTSVVLNYLMHCRPPKKTFTRVSAQFKSSTQPIIKITPK